MGRHIFAFAVWCLFVCFGRVHLCSPSSCQSASQSRKERESNSQQSTVDSRNNKVQWLVAWHLAVWRPGGGLKRQAAGLAQERESPVRAAQCGRPQLASLSESQVWVHPKGPRGAWVRFLSDRDPPRALRSQVPERTQRQVQRQVQRAPKKQVTAEAGHRRSQGSFQQAHHHPPTGTVAGQSQGTKQLKTSSSPGRGLGCLIRKLGLAGIF